MNGIKEKIRKITTGSSHDKRKKEEKEGAKVKGKGGGPSAESIWHLQRLDPLTYPKVTAFVAACIAWLDAHLGIQNMEKY